MEHFKNIEDMLTDQFEKDIINAKIQRYYERSKKNGEVQQKGHSKSQEKEINFESLLHPDAQADDYRSGNQKIRQKIIQPSDQYDRLSQLKKGEWASIENKYRETGMFEFSVRGDGKVRSADDVAFIFRSLESQSIENAFAVYVDKDKHPFVQWISMGGITSTLVDQRLFVDAATRFEANEIYFVHNHPSGNINPSIADHRLIKKLIDAFEPFNIKVHGVIINLNSGKYSVFNEDAGILDTQNTVSENQEQRYIPVFSFSKRAFLSSPFETKISNSRDVAQFLSQQRFSAAEKRGYLLLDHEHKIIGNFFATETELNASVIEASVLAGRYGATSIIAYANKVEQDIHFYNNLKTKLKNLEINLLDAVQVEPSQYVAETYSKYISLADEGTLQEPENKHSSQSKTNIMEQKNLDYLANQMKYLGFGEEQKEALKNQMESGEPKFNITVKQQYDGHPVNYTLHFSKSNESDMYFLNAYDAEMANGRRQSVYLDKGKGFTAKETFNLMQDRAVFKELRNKNDGTNFEAWIKLADPEEGRSLNDSRKMHIYNENYGYDLEAALSKHPIKEIGNEDDKQMLLASLKKGNRQAVTFIQKDGEEVRKFVEANPRFKNLEVYNRDGSKMFIRHTGQIKEVPKPQQQPMQKAKSEKSKAVKIGR